jgi:hypothetical protein
MGLPTNKDKLTSEKIEEILSLVRLGNFVSTAARACGVSASAWSHLCARNPKVKEATEQAYSIAESNALRRIIEFDKDPKYLAWFLERRNPDHWGGVHKHQIDTLQKEIADLKAIIASLSNQSQ